MNPEELKEKEAVVNPVPPQQQGKKKRKVILESDPRYAEFENNLLRYLTCLRAVNFNQISYIGRNLDAIDGNRAYRILWCDEDGAGDLTYRRLQKLGAKGLVTPWKMWSPDRVLTCQGHNKASVKRKGVFYILGRDGRKFMIQNKNVKMFPLIIEEIYMTNIPLARWLTASSAALTLEREGYQLKTLKEVWVDREDVRKPLFKPDFVVEKNGQLFSFAIYDSPFGLQSQNFTVSAGRILNYLRSNSCAVILTRTKEAFKEILMAMKGDCLSDNKQRVFLGDLINFKQRYGHITVVNALDKEFVL